MDVRTKKWVFLRPCDGEKLFDPWASGRKGRERPQKIRNKKFMFMLFFFPDMERQLSQAIPPFHVERMLNERTPIARFESQHNERRVCED